MVTLQPISASPAFTEKLAALLKTDFSAFNLLTRSKPWPSESGDVIWKQKALAVLEGRFLLPAVTLESQGLSPCHCWLGKGSTEWVRNKTRAPEPRAPQRMKSPLLLTHRENPDVSPCTEISSSVHILSELWWRAWASLLLHIIRDLKTLFCSHLFPCLPPFWTKLMLNAYKIFSLLFYLLVCIILIILIEEWPSIP